MPEGANESRRDLRAQLAERALRDEAFRRALLADPKGTLERELQVKLLEEVNLTVVEETPTQRYLVLPPAPTGRQGELSDRELDAVAGGVIAQDELQTLCMPQSDVCVL